jgi:hypothetical protein
MKALAAGNGLGNIHDMKNLFFHHREDFFLDKPEQVASACAFVREHGIKVIYIDTFAKSITSDENSSKDMGIAVGSADKLRAAGATVVLVHHVAKRSPTLTGGRSGYPDPDKDLRGSSPLSGAYETHWAVRCYPTEDSKERDWVMLVGGKDVEQTAYIYDWKFENRRDENDEEFLASVKLVLEPLGTAMHIDAPKEAKGKHLRVVEENF